jgi:enoyl-CoA hydratase/carnithine racemase
VPINPPILRECEDGVLVLTFNRADSMNAWSPELEDAYYEELDAAERDPAIRAVVVTGSGRAFCAGVAMNDLDELQAGGSAVIDRPRPRWRPYLFPKPLIAALNGATAGLGLVEALYCDVRFAAAGVKMTTAFVRRGLIAEYGSAWLLPRLVGAGRARDLLLSGRVVLAEEAEQIGLVDFVAAAENLREEAVGYAREVAAACSPASIAVIKEQLRSAEDSTFHQAFDAADPLLRESLRQPDFVEGVASFVERRAAHFPPLDQSPG